MSRSERQSNLPGREMAGSLPLFPQRPGHDLVTSEPIPDFRQKRLILGQLTRPGDVHVYRADCRAGQRLRLQMVVPVLPMGRAVVPAVAVIAQSLPYSADVHKLPLELPAGYSAVVAPPPAKLIMPVQDQLTRARYYPGTTVDTRTLVSGRCYVVVWSPNNQMGKYALQVGYRWPLAWSYWAQIPRFWWQIRGWFGLSRTAAYVAAGGLLAGALVAWRKRRARRTAAVAFPPSDG